MPLMIQPNTGTENIDFFARNRTAVLRFMKYQHKHRGSTFERWLETNRKPPSVGRFSSPVTVNFTQGVMMGVSTPFAKA